MMEIIKFDALGKADHGWLQASHHFSFAQYYNPERMGFGTLRVINDDRIKPQSGFDTHPHRDMEIITYVRQGAITHKDSMDNIGKTTAGDVQVMSAGTGIFHSEFNLQDEDTRLYQIWIEPNQLSVKPRWDQREFPKAPVNDALNLLVSGDKRDDALFIYQDAKIYAGRLTKGKTIEHRLEKSAYILASAGELDIDGETLFQGDGAKITDQDRLSIHATTDSEILIIEV